MIIIIRHDLIQVFAVEYRYRYKCILNRRIHAVTAAFITMVLLLNRIGWAVIIVAALIASIILLWISWDWNAETPTTTVIESTHYASFIFFKRCSS